jgi:hypothetical protein
MLEPVEPPKLPPDGVGPVDTDDRAAVTIRSLCTDVVRKEKLDGTVVKTLPVGPTPEKTDVPIGVLDTVTDPAGPVKP